MVLAFFIVTPPLHYYLKKMSQSYSPGTILSAGFGPTLEQVIMLSDNKVATKTFAGKPVQRRDIMSMADWLLVIGDQKVQTDYLPLASGGSVAPSADAAVLPPVAMANLLPPVAEVKLEPEVTYPVGTKLSWKHAEGADQWYSPNMRTAIVLKDGILQVKEVINDVTVMTTRPGAHYQTCAQKFFSSLADWKAQLPAGGSITATEVTEDFTLPSIKRKAAKPFKATTDLGYIEEIQKRFSVCAYLEEGASPTQSLADQLANIRHQMTLVDTLTSAASMATTKAPREIADALEKADIAVRRMRRASKKASRIQNGICLEPSKAKTNPIWFTNAYRARLMAFVKGREIDICASTRLNLLGLAGNPDTGCFGMWFSPKTGGSFAHLGIDLKADGKPRLKVYYRRESIEL
jgi:hypothetical protein